MAGRVPDEDPFASSHSLNANPFESEIPFESENPFANPPLVDAQSKDSSVHADRVAELDRRERELAIAHENLALEQERIKNQRRHGNNWPPFLPVIFHDIRVEIPVDSQPLVQHLYLLWEILLGTLIMNMIACIFVLTSGSSDGGRDLGSSIGYIFVIGALSFLLWYRPIYNGYMKEQALYYYFYFFFGGWHLVFSIYMIIGIPGTGSAGLIQMIQMYAGGHIAAGILSTIATIGWIVQGLGNAFYYRQIWMHHTAQGHNINNAKTELATHWAKGMFSRGG
ncbi:scamp family-domain-containing protein [Phellopilus nigrolimitatus]|nr:scamp family-domain-containing protein [Phellopilus nigrolimitatus]